MNIINDCDDCGLIAGVITADNIEIGESLCTQRDELMKLVSARSAQEFPPENIRKAVRGMLKKGGFKPSGRNKPASEYLAQACNEDRFPFINNIVDINNYFSMLSGLPISILDRDVTGSSLTLRKGRKNESYIFNRSGQEISLEGLICLCGDDEPFGNPVKDSRKAKVVEASKNIIAVIYAPNDILNFIRIEELCRMFAAKLTEYAKADSTAIMVV